MEGKTILIVIAVIAFVFLTTKVPYCVPLPEEQLINESIKIGVEDNIVDEIKNELKKGFIVISTTGTSMLPKLLPNHKCICETKSNYEVGDIVLYYREFNGGNVGIAHELIFMDDGVAITRGINNDFIDSPIDSEEIICSIPYVKRGVLYGQE